MKTAFYKFGVLALLTISASASLAATDKTSLVFKSNPELLFPVTNFAVDPQTNKSDVQMVVSSQAPRAITAHNATEAQWLLKYLLRTKSSVELTYDPTIKSKTMTDVEKFSISVDGKDEGPLDAFVDEIRYALESDPKVKHYTTSFEGGKDFVMNHLSHKKVHPYPAGYPVEGVLK